ncbi:MAG: zinc metalloprotease HtpX [Gammaproteobacteria bacterium]|jgi:heat shock protein HtpX
MDSELVVRHKFVNFVQSAALVLLLAGLMSYLAWAIAGEVLAWFAFIAVLLLFISNPVITPQFILRMYDARPVTAYDAPQLHQLVQVLSQRAGLKQTPKLYYIPSRVINAFAMGSSQDSTIAVSDGVLRKLSFEELAGILAHEMTHVSNNDIRVMTFADITGRVTKLLSLFGQLLVLVNLPLILFTEVQLNWIPLLVMVFAPLLSDLIQLGLSRIREYDADLGSAILLGDARPLASALAKMEHYQHSFLDSIFAPVQKIPEPSLLRTHPPTDERIRRLLKFHESTSLNPLPEAHPRSQREVPIRFVAGRPGDPRRRFTGFWY